MLPTTVFALGLISSYLCIGVSGVYHPKLLDRESRLQQPQKMVFVYGVGAPFGKGKTFLLLNSTSH